MNDRITSTTTTQPQTTTPEQAASPAVPSGDTPDTQATPPEATVPQQAEQAAEEAAALEAKAREEAQSTLKATIRAYKQGEKAYRAGLLEAGKLADTYNHQRLALGDRRAAVVQTLEGQLAQYSSSTVDIDRLIGCHHAYRLLAEEPGVKADTVPYGHYRDAWRQLVQRTNKDTPQEAWVLLPGVEEEAKALFGKAVADSLGREAVLEQCKALQRRYAEAAAAQAQAERAKAQAEAEAKAAALREANAAAEAAAQEAQAKAAAAEQAQAEDKARLTAEAEKAKAELLAQQQALVAAHAEQVQAEAAKARAEADAKAAQQAAARAAEKAAKAAAAATERAKAKGKDRTDAEECRQPAMKAMAKAGTAKDVAAMAVELITGSDAPDDVLAELLRQLKASGHCSKQAVRAIDAALLVFHRPAVTPPAHAPVGAAA
jgi:hypothetical protein